MWFDKDFERAYTNDEILTYVGDVLLCVIPDSFIDDLIDELYPKTSICGIEFMPSHILKEMDITAWRTFKNEEIDNFCSSCRNDLAARSGKIEEGETLYGLFGYMFPFEMEMLKEIEWRA